MPWAGRMGPSLLAACLAAGAAGCLPDAVDPPEGGGDDDTGVPWPGDDDSAGADDDTGPVGDTPWPEPDPVLGIVTVSRWPEDAFHAEEARARALFVEGGIDARFHDPAYQICGDRIDTDGYFASYTYPNLGWFDFWDGSLWDAEGARALDVGDAVTIGTEPPLAVLEAVADGSCHAIDAAWFSAPLALGQWAWGQGYDLGISGGADVAAASFAGAVELGDWFVPTSHALDEWHVVPMGEPLALSWGPIDASGESTMLITLIGPTDTLLGRVRDTGATEIPADLLARMGGGDAVLLLARERETRVPLPEGDVVVRARFEYWIYLTLVD